MKYKILDNINNPNDLKRLSVSELDLLSEEIREFLIDNITKTGGHLAPNLGVVELTLALHYVFDSPRDSFIWDVGHQCYVHKMITGRKDLFPTIRQKNGLSGFPCPSESEHDIVHAGHSSTSVSLAVGIASAKKMNNNQTNTLAIIGDGSFTSGMVYEALNDAAWREVPLLIILNDNKMSISENVGGISLHLNKLRSNKTYLRFKQRINKFLGQTKVGRTMAGEIYSLKSVFKHILFRQKNMFENLGVKYFGPFDGHDVKHLITVFEEAKKTKEPMLLHILTKKGKGHQEACTNPINYHGIAGNNSHPSEGKSWSKIFGESLIHFANNDENIIAITAAMREGTGLVEYSKQFPDRFIDVGIAEEHAVTCAAGLAIAGKKPIVAMYSTFLQRGYDQLLHDISIGNYPVVFSLDRAGLVPGDGKTHQGVFDIAYLRTIPNMIIMSPLVEEELFMMLDFAFKAKQPVAIRYPKDNAPVLNYSLSPIILGQGIELESGNDGVIVIFGSLVHQALEALELLRKQGQNYALYHLRFAKPIAEEVLTYLSTKKNILIIEEGIAAIGPFLYHQLKEMDQTLNIILKSVDDCFPNTDSRAGLIQDHGFSPEDLIKDITN